MEPAARYFCCILVKYKKNIRNRRILEERASFLVLYEGSTTFVNK